MDSYARVNALRTAAVVAGLCTVLLAWFSPGHLQAGPPGAAIVQLTHDNAVAVRPAWSPDNRLIAYQSNRGGDAFHIYVMNSDGSNPRAVTQGSTDDRHPVWMPDGKAILFDASDGTASEIWTVNVADGSRRQLTHVGALASFASPSPDGQRIAFYVFKHNVLDIWTARVDGSQAKPLTQDLASADNNQCTFACHQAAWSPDNRTIAYSAGELDAIWTIPSDGGTPNPMIANGENNHFPWFMADGRLGYITEHINPGQSYTDAWVYDPQARKAAILQERMSPQGPFDWSADNQRVLFHSPRSGNFEIYMIDLTAPGGVQALQGTPVPAQPAAGANPPAAPESSAAGAPATTFNLPAVASALAVISFAVIATLGLVVWRRVRA